MHLSWSRRSVITGDMKLKSKAMIHYLTSTAVICILLLYTIFTPLLKIRAAPDADKPEAYAVMSPNYAKNSSQTTNQINNTNFVGVNVHGYYTSIAENGRSQGSMPDNYYQISFSIISQSRMNLVRYLFTWESYEKNPQLFMSEIQSVARIADKNGIKVIYANNQFHISSWLDEQAGYGFPATLFKDKPSRFPQGGGGASDTVPAKIWWTDWYNRSVHNASGEDGWTLQTNFLKQIVKAVDNNVSTLGYEILNEPQVYSVDQWDKIGTYNTFVANGLRTLTNKTLVFDRQLPSDIGGLIDAFPQNMAKMAPHNIKHILFKSTLYGLPTHCSYAEERLTIAKKTSDIAGAPLWIGEFNVGISALNPVADINQTGVDIFLRKFKEVNAWGWSFWWWSFYQPAKHLTNFDLVNFTRDNGNSNSTRVTKYFEYLKKGISAVMTSNNDSTNQSSDDTICPAISITYINNTKLESNYQSGTSPNNPITLNVKTTPSNLSIKGKAYDISSGLRIIKIKIDGYGYESVTPTSEGDWTDWSYLLHVKSKGAHKIVVSAADNKGNIKFNTLFIKAV
jgi:hypothetical protein